MEKKFLQKNINLVPIIIAILMPLIFIACASSSNEELSSQAKQENQFQRDTTAKYFSFYARDNGQNIFWRAAFKKGKLAELYRNNEKISDDMLNNYRDLVYDNLSDINKTNYSYNFNVNHLDFDSLRFNNSTWNDADSSSNGDSSFYGLDSNTLKNLMENLKDAMKNIKINIDTAALSESMKELKKSMKSFQVNFDTAEINNEMRKVAEDMKNNSFNLSDLEANMAGLKARMHALNFDMNNIKTHMTVLDKKLSKFRTFMSNLKDELVNDGVINDNNEKFDMDFSAKGIIINGKKLRDDLFEKYKKLYEDDLGEKVDETTHIVSH
jgi:hypothetical protein